MNRVLLAGRLLGRRFLLEQTSAAIGRVRFLSTAVEVPSGATSWVTLTRTGNFSDPRYGDFSITLAMLNEMVGNFQKRVLGQDVFLDVNHEPGNGAAAKVLELAVDGGRLRGRVEWTDYGRDAVKVKGFRYLSAEFHEQFQDNEAKALHGCVLLGAGLTNRPVIKHLDPIQLSEGDHEDAPARVAISPSLLKELTAQKGQPVNYLEQLKARLLAMGLSEPVVTKLLAQAKDQIEALASDGAKALAMVNDWAATGQAVADQIAAAGGVPINLSVGAPADVDAAVVRILAQRDQAAQQAARSLTAKHKLLADTIQAGDSSLTPEQVNDLAQEVQPLVSSATTDDQVKGLAEHTVKNAQRLSAATKLSSMGYSIPGSARITVDGSNSIKSLQSTIDKRLGYEGMTDAERFASTGGRLLSANKAFADKALAQFDAIHGERLVREHKQLAGGVGSVADAAVPAIAERTVLREALYGLTSLNFVNVGTVPFAETITIPYSYRDRSAAGRDALRRYEGQGIRRAGIIQTADSAHPLPQKLSYLVSEELQLLLSSSQIDFDPLAENIRNVIRIVGEDTEMINMNELVCSADEAGVASFADTLTSQVDGTKSQFVTTKYPVVRERKVFDIRGQLVGSTVNPLTITLNNVVRSEFALPADGSAPAAGLYYVMDYNLGTFRFVDQTGTTVAPTSGWVLTVNGKYSTNAVTFNVDPVEGEKPKERFDRLLTLIGGRKVVIEQDRFYQANLLLMSGAVDNMVSQAESYGANSARLATGLAADGSVGTVKNMPAYNPTAPGLMLGDTRILVGERGNTRFRMAKPFAMNPPENARNAQGQFTAQKEGFGTQWVVSHTPSPLKNSLTSVILYSATGRVPA